MIFRTVSDAEEQHEVEWDDGISVTVYGPWKVAHEIGSGRVVLHELRETATFLRDNVRDIQSVSTEVVALLEKLTSGIA